MNNYMNSTNYTDIYSNYIDSIITISNNLFNKTQIFLLKHEVYINHLTNDTITIIKSVPRKRDVLFTILYTISVYIICFTVSYTLHIINNTLYSLYKHLKYYYNSNYVLESVDENNDVNSVNHVNSVNSVNNYNLESKNTENIKNDLLIKINSNNSSSIYPKRSVMKVRRSTRIKKEK